MRAARLVLIAFIASTTFSTSAPARPRIPGVLLGAMAGTVGGIMALRHRHAYAHRHRARASRVATKPAEQPRPATVEPAGTAAATATASQPAPATPAQPTPVTAAQPATNAPTQSAALTPSQPAAAPAQPATTAPSLSAWTGPLFLPRLADDIVDYVFWPSGGNDRFWSYGYGDVVDGAVRSTSHPDANVTRRGRSTTAVASGAGVAPGPCTGQQAAQTADAVIARIEETIQPTEAQKAILTELRTAALRGLEYIDTACPTDRPQTPTARLDSMEDRLWAARQALLVTRAPIAKLYASLTDEQKARLDGPSAAPAAQNGDRNACAQPADAATARLEQRVRPSNEQRPALEALRMTSMGLAKMLMASCPTGPAATPMERLDAADKRLNSLLYTVVVLRAPLDGFYASLSDQQKTRFNASR